MRSDIKVRFVEATTPPFKAWVVVKAAAVDQVWVQAKAEALLMEQIRDQVGERVKDLSTLKKMGVYTVRYDREQGHYVHDVDAPAGVNYLAVEEVPRWWEAVDSLPLDAVPSNQGLILGLLPSVTMETWRNSSWPDRPHP